MRVPQPSIAIIPYFLQVRTGLNFEAKSEDAPPRVRLLRGVVQMSMLSLQIPSGRARNPGLWARVWRFIETSQTRQADVVIRQHCHLLPHELEQAGLRLDERSEKNLPFTG
jgi:hypothetical protein